jgi:hypothetical protein
MPAIPNYRQILADKREVRAIEEQKKRKYRILCVNLPFVVGEDERFPDQLSVNKHIECVYQEEFGERKTIAQIKVWLGARDHNW